jgi:hypothetical protein
MEPQTFERRQGNSLWIKIKCRKWADIDTTWTNFSGSWKLMDSTGATLQTGTVVRSSTEGIMYVKITPAMTLPLAVGYYTLATEIVNTVQDYKEERQDSVVITGTSAI